MSKELGQALKALRKQCELTQRQVSEVLHIDRSTYAYYEKGTTEPDLKSIRKLAQVFNVDPVALLPKEDGKLYVRAFDVTNTERQNELPAEYELDLKDEKIFSIAKDERSILVMYRTLSPEQKEKFRDFAQKLHRESE